jgi:hypothetical protein
MLADCSRPSGYKFVRGQQNNRKFIAEFKHGKPFVAAGFKTAYEAARYVVEWFAKHYGDQWYEHLFPRQHDRYQGAGWRVIKVGKRWRSCACVMGEWLNIVTDHDDTFATVSEAKQAAQLLIEHVRAENGIFGYFAAPPMPFAEPTKTIVYKAKTKAAGNRFTLLTNRARSNDGKRIGIHPPERGVRRSGSLDRRGSEMGLTLYCEASGEDAGRTRPHDGGSA